MNVEIWPNLGIHQSNEQQHLRLIVTRIVTCCAGGSKMHKAHVTEVKCATDQKMNQSYG